MKRHLRRIPVRGDISQKKSIPQFAPGWCFFLDLDGTLIDIAERPKAVNIDAALRDLLRQLIELTGGAVALVSGRSIADIDRLFLPMRMPVAGQHGLERRDILGNIHVLKCETEPLHYAAQGLEKLVAQYPKLELEKKGMTLAMHFRRAPDLAATVAAIMHRILGTLGSGFELLNGKMLLEVKPKGKDKGIAIAEFMQEEPFKSRVPVYIGDDTTDESGFAVVNEMGGHTVKVGDGVTGAQWRLGDATAVRAWLMAFVDHCLSSLKLRPV